jgi:CheY-like chemotaxis protein/anti-sigma regulatory factor (Ser/Thr protein kinase)
MKQVLVNLLSNAVKFTPEGGRIGIQVREGRDTIAITVWDHGIGIAPSDLPRLFQPFVQLDSRLSRAHAGTGLGLTLVRRLVELHGGEVRVESQPGRGSRFTIELPARRPGSDPSPSPRRDPSRPLAITPMNEAGPLVLIAEDEEMSAHLLHDVLSVVGYRVERARDGAEAVELARALRPAAILMDVQMPAMDGLSAIRALRADDDPALRAVPIVALTALTMAGDEQRCLSAGASVYLSKPLSYKRLLATLEGWLRGDAAAG